VDVTNPGLHRMPLPISEIPRKPGCGRSTQPRHRRDHLPGSVGALPVKPHEEVLPGQLRGRDPDQQLSAGMPALTGLNRPDRRIQQFDHTESVDQLGHRRHPRHRSQRRIRRTRQISRTLSTR
jgi:hypothetical protein